MNYFEVAYGKLAKSVGALAAGGRPSEIGRVILLIFLAFCSYSPAGVVLIEEPGDLGSIGGAIFQGPPVNVPANDSNAFLDLRDQGDAHQSGFNSLWFGPSGPGDDGINFLKDPSNTDVDDQEQSKDLPLSAVPIVNIAGEDYRQFALGVNQQGNGPIDILQLQIGQHSTSNVSDWSNLDVTNVYTMTGDTVTVHGDVHSGTGLDLFVYVKDSQFDQTKGFVYLFAEMGGSVNGANDGQDRWLTNRSGTAFVPEPSAFVFLSLVTVCIGGWRRFKTH